MNLDKLKDLDLKKIIDVGAFKGEFSDSLSKIYPEADFFMIEANPFCREHLFSKKHLYKICCLSNIKKEIDFFLEDSRDVCEGASYFLENTKHFTEKRSIKLLTETLDNLNLFSGCQIDLLKLDTQGSELDILNGGVNTLSRSRFLLIETSLYQYNNNAPLLSQFFDFLEKKGFSATRIIEEHKISNTDLIFQIDFLFKNNNYE